MSLNQVIPPFKPAEGLGSGQVRPLKRMKAAAVASIRTGGSVDELVQLIRDNDHVAVDGAVCAGKSTTLPRQIAEAFGMLVIHVVPSVYLCSDLCEYLASVGKQACCVLDVDVQWPEAGVAVVPAAVIQAKFMQSGQMKLPDCILYHDEVHKSDCWTNLLSCQWGSVVGVMKYVTASATSGVTNFRKPETPGRIVHHKYDPSLRSSDWSVFRNDGHPWEVSSIQGNVLIYEDDADRAFKLVADYRRAGMEPYRLHSRMKLEQFRGAMASLKRGSITVLIADSSFRDGYTWSLSKIIDTGVVHSLTVQDGNPARYARDAYQFEMYQGAARGGRVFGQHVDVWQPNMVFEPKRVMLEEVEVEAVALVSRLLSTLVPIHAMDAVMAEGKVPRDLYSALVGTMPLACLRDTQLTVLASGGYARSSSPVVKDDRVVTIPGSDFHYPGMSADKSNERDLRLYAESVDSASTRDTESTGLTVPTVAAHDIAQDFSSWFVDDAVRVSAMEVGKYYYAPGVPTSPIASAAFPEGWKSVVRVFASRGEESLLMGLPDENRNVAIAALLQRYNTLACELNALGLAVQDAKALGVGRSAVKMHEWVSGFLERSTAVQAELLSHATMIRSFVNGYAVLEELPSGCLADQEKALCASIVESVRGLPRQQSDPGGYVRSIQSLIDVPEEVVPLAVYSPPGAGDDRKYAEMALKGRGARPKVLPLSPFMGWVTGMKGAHAVKATSGGGSWKGVRSHH